MHGPVLFKQYLHPLGVDIVVRNAWLLQRLLTALLITFDAYPYIQGASEVSFYWDLI